MLKYITRDNSSPDKKAKIYFCCHPDDFNHFFNEVMKEIFSTHNVAVFYHDFSQRAEESKDLAEQLREVQLIIVAVNSKLLLTDNYVKQQILPLADEYNISVLPIVRETGLEKEFAEVFGEKQYLDSATQDVTAISYKDKLRSFLDSIIVGDELAEKIRAAFDAYIFLSYRKKDRKYAQTLMRLIHKNDFCRDIAIWYDEFLVPGENFNTAIKEALEKSPLFALTVTQNLLEQGNYVMQHEYPMAVKAGKKIVPVSFTDVDNEELKKAYPDLPEVVGSGEEKKLYSVLDDVLTGIAIRGNESPEHDFFIGLAYLSGIDVERNTDMAVSLISSCSERGLPEATEKLARMYYTGDGVKISFDKTLFYQRLLVEQLRKAYESSPDNKSICNWYADAYCKLGSYLSETARGDEALSVLSETIRLCDEIISKSPTEHLYLIKYQSSDNIGLIKTSKHDYDGAIAAYEKSFETLKVLCKVNSEFYGYFLANTGIRIGNAYFMKKDFEKAEWYLLPSHKLMKDYFESDLSKYILYIYSFNSLGVNYMEAKDFVKAEKFFAEGIELYERHYLANEDGSSVPFIALYLNAADLYRFLNQYEKSHKLYLKAEELTERTKEHYPFFYEKNMAEIYSRHSILMMQISDLNTTLVYIDKAISLNEKLHQKNPDMYAMILSGNYNGKGIALIQLGKNLEAVKYLEKAVAMMENEYKRNPLIYGNLICTYYGNVVTAYSLLCDKENMNKYALLTLDTAKYLYKELPSVFLSDYALACAAVTEGYINTGEYGKAIKCCKEGIDCYSELVKQSPQVYGRNLVLEYNQLGVLYYNTQRYSDAEKYYIKAIQVLGEIYGDNEEVYISGIHSNLFQVYFDMGRYEEAERELDKEIELTRKMPQNSSESAQVNEFILLINKGHLRCVDGKYDKAEEYYILAYNKLKPLYMSNPVAHSDNYRVILECLADISDNLGKNDMADIYRQELNQM